LATFFADSVRESETLARSVVTLETPEGEVLGIPADVQLVERGLADRRTTDR
jgi:hypothetical protein